VPLNRCQIGADIFQNHRPRLVQRRHRRADQIFGQRIVIAQHRLEPLGADADILRDTGPQRWPVIVAQERLN
jgi:hypothetical protein